MVKLFGCFSPRKHLPSDAKEQEFSTTPAGGVAGTSPRDAEVNAKVEAATKKLTLAERMAKVQATLDTTEQALTAVRENHAGERASGTAPLRTLTHLDALIESVSQRASPAHGLSPGSARVSRASPAPPPPSVPTSPPTAHPEITPQSGEDGGPAAHSTHPPSTTTHSVFVLGPGGLVPTAPPPGIGSGRFVPMMRSAVPGHVVYSVSASGAAGEVIVGSGRPSAAGSTASGVSAVAAKAEIEKALAGTEVRVKEAVSAQAQFQDALRSVARTIEKLEQAISLGRESPSMRSEAGSGLVGSTRPMALGHTASASINTPSEMSLYNPMYAHKEQGGVGAGEGSNTGSPGMAGRVAGGSGKLPSLALEQSLYARMQRRHTEGGSLNARHCSGDGGMGVSGVLRARGSHLRHVTGPYDSEAGTGGQTAASEAGTRPSARTSLSGMEEQEEGVGAGAQDQEDEGEEVENNSVEMHVCNNIVPLSSPPAMQPPASNLASPPGPLSEERGTCEHVSLEAPTPQAQVLLEEVVQDACVQVQVQQPEPSMDAATQSLAANANGHHADTNGHHADTNGHHADATAETAAAVAAAVSDACGSGPCPELEQASAAGEGEVAEVAGSSGPDVVATMELQAMHLRTECARRRGLVGEQRELVKQVQALVAAHMPSSSQSRQGDEGRSSGGRSKLSDLGSPSLALPPDVVGRAAAAAERAYTSCKEWNAWAQPMLSMPHTAAAAANGSSSSSSSSSRTVLEGDGALVQEVEGLRAEASTLECELDSLRTLLRSIQSDLRERLPDAPGSSPTRASVVAAVDGSAAVAIPGQAGVKASSAVSAARTLAPKQGKDMDVGKVNGGGVGEVPPLGHGTHTSRQGSGHASTSVGGAVTAPAMPMTPALRPSGSGRVKALTQQLEASAEAAALAGGVLPVAKEARQRLRVVEGGVDVTEWGDEGLDDARAGLKGGKAMTARPEHLPSEDRTSFGGFRTSDGAHIAFRSSSGLMIPSTSILTGSSVSTPTDPAAPRRTGSGMLQRSVGGSSMGRKTGSPASPASPRVLK